ncbi:nuclear transport factor 2 family protein [Bdellovibrio bacteriovorus]|uniref:YybH family protein n=1 Tax=Bdellovibrio TaxID=958 RepID=UPI0035A87A1B
MALQTTQPEKRKGPVSTEEGEIRRLMEQYSEAVSNKDLEEIMSFYAPDVIAFDLMPPLQVIGKDAYKKSWSNITQMGESNFSIRDLHVTARGDLGFCHCLCHMTGTTGEGQKFDSWARQTACFEKINGRWLIVHENYSVPIDMENEKPLMNLDPDQKPESH